MALKTCTYIPSKGKSLHKQLKDQFGYELGTKVFLTGLHPQFIKDYGTSLTLDSEGVPTYASLMSIPYIKTLIGKPSMKQSLNKKYSIREDTIENYNQLLQEAKGFNDSNPNNSDYVAIVTREDKGIKVSIVDKTEDNIKTFTDQYSAHLLNRKLLSIFGELGVTPSLLNAAEVNAGRVGVVDFSQVSGIAKQFSNLIRIANNMEGATALTEEFSHLIVGMFREQPLVVRAINSLQRSEETLQDILQDDYQKYYDYYGGDTSLIAEEALGHLLRDNMVKQTVQEDIPHKNLIQRIIAFIKNAFKKFNADEVETAIIDSNEAINYLAKKILQGNKPLDRSMIRASRRDVQFNALSQVVETNIQILKEAAKTELKRGKISQDASRTGVNTLVEELISRASSEDAKEISLGLLNYSRTALNELKILNDALTRYSEYTPGQQFAFLRKIKLNIDSYGQFIQSLRDNINEAKSSGELEVFQNIDTADGVMSVQEVLRELAALQEDLYSDFLNKARRSFAEYLKPIMGEAVVIKGQEYTVKDLLKEAPGDISLLDRWLDSMEESSDVILKAFDNIYKGAQNRTRMQAIEAVREIQRLQEQAERQGITTFDWMFETTDDGNKTGNYIQEINYGQFEKDREDFENYLDERYGENPRGEEARAKIAERDAWYLANSNSLYGTAIPKGDKYKNQQYENLTQAQKDILKQFLELKNKFDLKYPDSRTSLHKAIQIRKDKGQRIFQSLTSPATIVSNLKESIANAFLEREDDDQLFGDSMTVRGIKNFDGSEFMSLPILYTNRLKNPNDLSTDVFGSLMAYAYSAINYEQIEEVIDPLEVGRAVMKQRKVVETRGNKQVVEKIKGLNVEAVNKIFKDESYINAKLDDFFASKIYHRYLKDEGTWEVMGKQISKNKVVSWVLQGSSFAQLGFNWLANLANVTTGVSMQNIEAFAGEHFNASELLQADKIYASEIIGVLEDNARRIKQSKLSLFDELFDVKQNFGQKISRLQSKNILKRILGGNLHFLGQEAGDHWMYNRTAIAMALRKQVIYRGERMSLWEALEVKSKYADSDIKELNYRDIQELDGSPLDVGKFGREVATVNHGLFGIYNDEDANAANRVAMGRLLQQYRKWMKPQFNRRFGDDGYYKVMGRIMNDLIRGHVQYSMLKDSLSPHEKAQVKRALFELVQWFAVWAIANFVEWPDDKDRPWIFKGVEYGFKRLAHELGGLAPTLTMPRELAKTAQNPIPSSSVFIKAFNVVGSLVDPRDWIDEAKSGPYKGMSTLHKNILKAPIPGIMEYKQIDRFLENIDTSIDFYVRNTQ